jgi:putative spermidine/putrescine transport system ATP-binding protein
VSVSPQDSPLEGVSVTLVNCRKHFGADVPALSRIDLQVRSRETVVLLGPSGCGKTTTLRIMAGLEYPDAGGRVLFDNEDVTDRPVERRNVGIVFQSYALFPNMSVAENVEYGLRVRRIAKSARRQRVEEMLALTRIEELRNRRIDQLSGGQRQRVALARAIAVRPRVLLLDEPLAALDAKLRDTLRTEIDALLRQLGITSIYVTHDQAEAMALGDRVVVMNEGAIEQIGTPREIYHQPATRFVANFIGKMNVLAGESLKGRLSLGAQPVDWNGPDGSVEVMFRPHDVELCEPGAGHLQGRVSSFQFLGDRTSATIDIDGREIAAEFATDVELIKQARISLRLKPERIVMLGGRSQSIPEEVA